MRLFILFCLLFYTHSPIFGEAKTQPNKKENVTVDFISEHNAISSNKDLWLGIRFKLEKDWHIYWKNVGDNGLATSITFEPINGVKFGEIQWPAPKKFVTSGLVSYGYHNEVMLLTKVKFDDQINDREAITFKANVSWLECKTTCIPGHKKLELTLPIQKSKSNQLTASNQALFNNYRSLLPIANKKIYTYKNSDGFTIGIQSEQPIEKLEYFPHLNDSIEHNFKSSLDTIDNYREISIKTKTKLNDNIKGLLKVYHQNSSQTYLVDSTLLSKQPPIAYLLDQNPTSIQGTETYSFLYAIAFAFLGGLLLNIMPCVLPVLSVKILQVLSHHGEDKSKTLLNALSYTTGVLISFWCLASALILLRQTGHELGWGFQMQSPIMISILMGVFFIFALNLFGVFEIGVGLVGVDQKVKSNHGYLSAFFSGVLATVAATPCTAPFMGTALAFAITQPFIEALLVFTGLGLGMASPFILAGVFPKVMKYLPKPGAWMQTFKQFLGFLLMATVAYLFYVYTTVVTDQEQNLWMGICLVLFSIACWIWGKWSYAGGLKTWITRGATLTLIVFGLFITLPKDNNFTWEQYDKNNIISYLNQGKPVFLDFTASWCLSCKVNEKSVIETQITSDLFNSYNVVPMKADWSQYNPEITKALEELGRNSVPVYALYDPKNPTQPTLLPEVLTHHIIKTSLKNLSH